MRYSFAVILIPFVSIRTCSSIVGTDDALASFSAFDFASVSAVDGSLARSVPESVEVTTSFLLLESEDPLPIAIAANRVKHNTSATHLFFFFFSLKPPHIFL